ncbi:MAG: negative regulator of flagellin synthesis FlgM [Halieaceae bacterium]|jgi:negative regulator of flagellin synthesis FlgM
MNPIDSNLPVRQQRTDVDRANQSAQETRAATSATAVPEPTAPGADGESVTLTRAASSLLQLEQELQELPGVDSERVNQIRSAIDEGSYKIDITGIVDSLLRVESELR